MLLLRWSNCAVIEVGRNTASDFSSFSEVGNSDSQKTSILKKKKKKVLDWNKIEKWSFKYILNICEWKTFLIKRNILAKCIYFFLLSKIVASKTCKQKSFLKWFVLKIPIHYQFPSYICSQRKHRLNWHHFVEFISTARIAFNERRWFHQSCSKQLSCWIHREKSKLYIGPSYKESTVC